MAHQAAHHPRKVAPKPREKGAAHTAVSHDRRTKSVEAKYGVMGAGATLVGVTTQSTAVSGNPANYYPGIVSDASGLRAYNSGGVITLNINAADGSLTITGTGTITGGTIQTSTSNPKVIMDVNGLRGYNGSGAQTFNLSGADGSLVVTGGTITGGTIQTSSGSTSRVVLDANGLRAYDASGNNTVNINTSGVLTVANGTITLASSVNPGTGARVVLNSSGVAGYNASNVQKFLLDATTGLITATGVITATGGSSLPVSTIVGNLPAGSNRYSNANFQNGVNTFDASGWTFTNAAASNGQNTVAPIYGALTCLLTTAGAGDVAATSNIVIEPTSPGLALVTAAGNLGIGAYKYTVTFVTVSGETTPSPETSVTTTSGHQQVTVTIPVGPANTIARNIYRTAVGGATGTEKLVTQVNDNTTTSYTDNVADGSLGANQPTVNTAEIYRRVVPTLNYTFSHYVWPATNARQGRIDINWYDINGVLLSTTTGTAQTTTLSSWNRITATGTAPANAAFANGVHKIGLSAATSDLFYIQAFQMEMSDRVSAWMARPDEILYYKINANNILVSSLSAISANIGSVTSGTITGVLIQTAAAGTNPRVWFDSTGISATNASGTTVFNLPSSGSTATFTGQLTAQGINFGAASVDSAPPPSANAVNWLRPSDSKVVGAVWTYSSGSTQDTSLDSLATASGDTSQLRLRALDQTGSQQAAVTVVQSRSGPIASVNAVMGASTNYKIIDQSGVSDFLLKANNLSEVPGLATLNHGLTVTGAVTASAESAFGYGNSGGNIQAHIGTWNSNGTFAYVAYTSSPSSSYALLFNSSDTYVSAPSTGHLRINNGEVAYWNSGGLYGSSGRKVVDTSGNSDFMLPAACIARSTGGSDQHIANTITWQTVLAGAGGNLGDGQSITVPSGQTWAVWVEGQVLLSADSANWTPLDARVHAFSSGTGVINGASQCRIFSYNYNAANQPDWVSAYPKELFLLGAGTYSFYIDVKSGGASYGGYYTTGSGWNYVAAFRVA